MVSILEKQDLNHEDEEVEPLQQVREDAFADVRHWKDDGCDISPSCLACPLPVCRYDVQGGIKAILAASRNEEIFFLHDTGHTAEAISERVGISRRSVFRVLSRNKKPDPRG